MISNSQKSFYQYQNEGGTLPITAKTYVPRNADEDLYQFGKSSHENNRVCSILAPRQTGKSSLMARTAHRLSSEGLICVQINLQELGRVDSDEKLWYSLLEEICKQIDELIEHSKQADAPHKTISFTSEGFVYKLDEAWGLKPDMPAAKRFTNFITDEILTNTNSEKLIVFLDEIQSLIRWEVKDSFIGYIKAISDNVNKASLQRLKFVILGVAKPGEFVTSRGIILNVGTHIQIGNLSGNCEQLKPGLEKITNEPQKLINIILNWTGGQPFLTQLICYLLVSQGQDQVIEHNDWESYIANTITSQIITNWRSQDRQSHLQEIENSIIRIDNSQKSDKLAALANYQLILRQGSIRWDEKDASQWDLLISGLVTKVVTQDGRDLKVANRIYEQVFNSGWIRAVQNQLDSSKDKVVLDNIRTASSSRPEIVDLPRSQGKMVANNDELVNKGLKLLRDELLPFVEKEMTEHCGKDWLQHPEVVKVLQQRPRKKNEDKPHLDTQALLYIIWNNWNEVFSHTLAQEERTLVSELRMTRNKAKHDESFTNEDGYRALDSITRLLKAVSASAEGVAEVEQMKNNLLRKQFEEQTIFNQQVTEQVASTQTDDTTEFIALVEAEPLSEKNQTAGSSSIEEPMPQPNFPLPNAIADNRRFTMSRAKQIEDIIKLRCPRVEKIRTVEENLNVIADALGALDARRQQLILEVKDANINDRLKTMDFYHIRDKVRRERDNLEKLRLRLSRDTLNLGVVGLMGQGKSTFLQTTGGLTNDVIPALRGGACTAVRSTICHQEGETYADVTVHSEESFLKEVIAPYYQELGLGNAPKTLEDLAKPLPDFSGGDATLASMYEHLKRDYHDHLQQYRHLLKAGSPRKIPQVPKEQIYKYVSQPRNAQGDLITFDHLVVREVKIFCPFPKKEVGKIALVDVPGLGDTRLGDEQLILETLGQEVDLVLFVRRPDPLRYGWEKRDTDLYKTAYQALNNLENRSFMILNHVSGHDDNLEACNKHQATISDKHINVIRCEIANCSNPDEANRVLDLVLDYLASNITSLDDQYARIYQQHLYQLQKEVSSELDKARQDWTTALPLDDVNDQGKFLRLFDQLWENLTWGLEELLYEVDREQQPNNEQKDDFKQQVALVIEKCKEDTGIPQLDPVTQQSPVEQIMKRKPSLLDWPTTYARYLHDIRTHLTRHFEAMDNGLKKSVEQAKSRLTDLLVEQANLGNIPRLTNVRGDQFLKIMAETIPDGLPRLKEAFRTFSNFEMSYRANFRSLIRPLLNNLNPNRTDTALSPLTGPETPEVRKKMAEEILSCLEVLHGEAVYRCEQALPEIYSEPRKTIFIEVEEFVDQVLRAKDVKNEWQIFLYQERAYIWPSEYGQDRDGIDRIEWLKLVEQATEANQPQKMQFLN